MLRSLLRGASRVFLQLLVKRLKTSWFLVAILAAFLVSRVCVVWDVGCSWIFLRKLHATAQR